MTPKGKAIEIIAKYQNIEFLSTNLYEFGEKDIRNMGYKRAKQCALIAVDQILDNTIGIGESGVELSGDDIYSDIEFWEAVKQELEKL